MKKNTRQKFMLIITLVCFIPVFLSSCKSLEKIEYYSHKGNYISVTGTVSYMEYNEDSTALYIELSDSHPILDDTCFKIVGRNLEIVQINKIDDKLKTGEPITIITAPRYFGDGYVMPIVAISINGEDLLEFEEGYKYLLDWLSK